VIDASCVTTFIVVYLYLILTHIHTQIDSIPPYGRDLHQFNRPAFESIRPYHGELEGIDDRAPAIDIILDLSLSTVQ